MTRPSQGWLFAIVLSVLLAIAVFTLTWVRSGPGTGKPPGDPLPEPLSYKKPAEGGQFFAIVFGDPAEEAKLKGDAKAKVEAARRFPKQGIYRTVSPDAPIWTFDGYAPDENLYLTSDGKFVVRLEGDWWRTKIYPAGKRLAQEVEKAQLEAPALSFLTDGKIMKQYRLQELVTASERLPHSPQHILWPGGAVLNESTGQFILFAQDSTRTIFDYRDGTIISQDQAGLGSNLAHVLLFTVLGLMVLVAGGWAYFALFRGGRRKRVNPPPSSSE